MRSVCGGLAALGLLLASLNGCGGTTPPDTLAPSPSSVSPTSPSPPPPPSVVGGWAGSFSDEDGSGSMRWQVSSQSGASFTGTVVVIQNAQSAAGTLTGSVAASGAVSFEFRFNDCSGGCATTGTATLSGTAIMGTYRATNARSVTVNGQFTLNRLPS